jgi:hypothetical protein
VAGAPCGEPVRHVAGDDDQALPGVHLSVPVGCQSVASSPAEVLVAKIMPFVAEDDPTARLLRWSCHGSPSV